MCLTIPAKVEKAEDLQLSVRMREKVIRVKNAVAGGCERGDWVLVNADLAVGKISEDEAREILDILKL